MKIQPTNQNFNGKYKFTKLTSYGRRIHGQSRGYDLDVYIKENDISKEVEHKLYCVFENGKWVKSFLRYFSDNKLHKEIRSEAK